MSNQHIICTVEFKLYPNAEQKATLARYLRVCCWLYNQALEQRIKAYRRRKESTTLYDQCAWLALLRLRMKQLRDVPSQFERDALRRVDRGFKSFFRRIKVGEKPGFPRFRPCHRYSSLESLAEIRCLRPGKISVPGIGKIRARGLFDRVVGKQKCIRVVRRASGWYAQIIVDQGYLPATVNPKSSIGIDVGLESFLTTSDGEKVANPRFFRRSEKKLKRLQRKVSKCQRRSQNRKKAIKRLARQHERVGAQRRNFAHQVSRRLVDKYDLIAFEDLNIKCMAAGMLAKSVNDVAWEMFLFFVTYKAVYAGRHAVGVDPRGTSQTCPQCGAVKKKSLSERTHACSCGLVIDRDHASARVILARALGIAGATACGALTATWPCWHGQVSRDDESGNVPSMRILF